MNKVPAYPRIGWVACAVLLAMFCTSPAAAGRFDLKKMQSEWMRFLIEGKFGLVDYSTTPTRVVISTEMYAIVVEHEKREIDGFFRVRGWTIMGGLVTTMRSLCSTCSLRSDLWEIYSPPYIGPRPASASKADAQRPLRIAGTWGILELYIQSVWRDRIYIMDNAETLLSSTYYLVHRSSIGAPGTIVKRWHYNRRYLNKAYRTIIKGRPLEDGYRHAWLTLPDGTEHSLVYEPDTKEVVVGIWGIDKTPEGRRGKIFHRLKLDEILRKIRGAGEDAP